MRVGLTMTFVFGRMTTKIILVFPPIAMLTYARHTLRNSLSRILQVY
jgi:hypothetical protein